MALLVFGEYECEVFGNGPVEAESKNTWENCEKHFGHASFIPAPQFNMDHMPEGFKMDLHLHYVRYISKRTVRLKVGYVSWGRPPGYTFAASRGEKRPHWGSGWINDVSYYDGLCFCQKCADKPDPKIGYCTVKVHTALHVVYDTEEAQNTEIDLFYDGDLTLKDSEKPKVLKLYGIRVSDANIKRDLSTIMCVTHEKSILNELSTFQAEKRDMWKALRTHAATPPNNINACIIISHPHGQPKKITVGKLVNNLDSGGIATMFESYDANTCRGCSGGPVIVWRAGEVNPDPYLVLAPHCFSSRKDCGTSGGRPFFFC
ncbi:hypothetical protein RRG08_026521 [Elysia crispata]|uniref:Uncharacterized protein n=1 Tax=Elysia crispata TaxID=231223 RepID=A0AAE0Y4W1_9GAST|nr:hypothetical protein RRG08_026521 [Elysia crispata]